MACVILLWLTCSSWIVTYSLARYAGNRQQAIKALLKVGRQVQDRADMWKAQCEQLQDEIRQMKNGVQR